MGLRELKLTDTEKILVGAGLLVGGFFPILLIVGGAGLILLGGYGEFVKGK